MSARAMDFDIDLIGRVLDGGRAILPRRVVVTETHRTHCAWEGCTETPAIGNQPSRCCPDYCRRHCIQAHRQGAHVCGRTQHREHGRSWKRKTRRTP